MALTKPVLLTTPAFDATLPQTFIFQVISGTQPTGNTLTIRNNATNTVVYQQTQTTFKFEHILPANTLVNGTYYNATLTTVDVDGNISPVSNTIQFWCYTTPVITFTNIPSSGTIGNSSYNFEFTYTQAQNELLNSYVVNLYNSSHNLVSSSGTLYVSSTTPPPTDLTYLFSGFEDGGIYYVEVNGIAIEGNTTTTGQIQINVKYLQPDIFTLMELTNNCMGGYITIKSNIVLVTGSSNPYPPTYINNEQIDLSKSGTWVKWAQGYMIGSDMTARIWVRKPTPNSEIARFNNVGGDAISIKYMQGYENEGDQTMKSYFTLTAQNINGPQYFVYSNYTPIQTDAQYYFFSIRKVGNLYDVALQNLG